MAGRRGSANLSEGKSVVDEIKANYKKDVTDEFLKPIIVNGDAGRIKVCRRIYSTSDTLFFFNYRSDRMRELVLGLPERRWRLRFRRMHKTTMSGCNAEFPRRLPAAFHDQGGVDKQFEGEERFMIPSPKVASYDLQPEMSVQAVADKVTSIVKSNGVGHTGKYDSAVSPITHTDAALGTVYIHCVPRQRDVESTPHTMPFILAGNKTEGYILVQDEEKKSKEGDRTDDDGLLVAGEEAGGDVKRKLCITSIWRANGRIRFGKFEPGGSDQVTLAISFKISFLQTTMEVGPLPAMMGLACHKCWKEMDVQLSRCGDAAVSAIAVQIYLSYFTAKVSVFRRFIMFETTMTSWLDRWRQLVWIPNRVKSGWVSLEGASWEGEFSNEIRKSFGMPAPIPIAFLTTAASDTLSMAMAILQGLAKLNDDDGWTRKHTLTVHILGADIREVSCGRVFEEILHRTPEVKTLKVQAGLIDESINRSANSSSCAVRTYLGAVQSTIESAPLGRSYVLEYAAEWVLTTHIPQLCGKTRQRVREPDLYIGFNSGAAQATWYTWPTTFKLLVERRISSLFTAYNRKEAEGDAAMLRAAGAALHPALGPALNPWGSMNGVPTAHSVYGFQVENGWLAGGFR
ncbi:hypothetical protein B0H19DRAFT_1068981 [Mycena capillaripes]|nr:hypothetical protein B0H19DRAFT_1068981 [Mycena capillaripes]